MAVVLSSEESSYFSSSNLRRSYSQPNFVSKRPGFHSPPNSTGKPDFYRQPASTLENSSSSSIPSSPRTVHVESTDLSCSSTPPSSTLSLPTSDCDDDHILFPAAHTHIEDQIILPRYDNAAFLDQLEDLEPPLSPQTDSYGPSPREQASSTNTSRPESPTLFERAEDDIAVRDQPSRHVDYLSHNWKEEDIWSSWKLIVSRRGDYSNSARLENASWRTWIKSKNKLKTVSPETLNWLKDCDVTWLYGPLQPGGAGLHHSRNESKRAKSSHPKSLNKKPILKKRSVSELMLQRSLSTSSLVKQAAAAVQAQQTGAGRGPAGRPGLGRSITDSITFPLPPPRGTSQDNTFLVPSTASSGAVSPGGERKHIHFNETVDQCIAVEIKGHDDEDVMDTEADDPFGYDDSDSDDGAIMMKTTATKKRPPILKTKGNGDSSSGSGGGGGSSSSSSNNNNSNGESKTIAMLPSTTLKYRDDTPEPPDTAMKHGTPVYGSPIVSPSSSQETLRPSRPSGRLFATGADEDDEEEDDDDDDDGFTLNWRTSAKAAESSSSGLRRSSSSGSLGTESAASMQRTASGMLMPLEEGMAASNHDGVFGRVVDTVNTARDIAHVIWNVGWRR